jgi:ketosteroid isomerase-like protein
MQRLKGLALVCASVLAVALTATAQCSSPKTTDELRQCWQDSWNKKQLDSVLQLYADDGTLLTADGRFHGRDAIKAYFVSKMDAANVQFALVSIEKSAPNKIGYDSGSFQETSIQKNGGPAQQQDGNYLLIAQKDEKGNLLIVQHAFVAKKPSPAAAPCGACFAGMFGLFKGGVLADASFRPTFRLNRMPEP